MFRGHADVDWRLESTLGRALAQSSWSAAKYELAERSVIGLFKERAGAHLSDPPADRDLLGWLAVMRHYGAPTRVIDWTASPFVAAYFALPEVVPASQPCAI